MITNPEAADRLIEDAFLSHEALTLLLVADTDPAQVVAALGPKLEVDPDQLDLEVDLIHSGYYVATVAGGVAALELSGYADPSIDVLAALSRLGGAAAVARANIQAHERFGCARNGDLLFDDDEFRFVPAAKKRLVPESLRPLFDAAWVDLDVIDNEDGGTAAVCTAIAMASVFTGVAPTADDLRRMTELPVHAVRRHTYVD